jgi:hypothetical protein
MILLRQTASLKILGIQKDTGESVEELLQTAGQLAHLHSFMLVVTKEPLRWGPHLSSIVASSFPSLVYFNLHVTELDFPDFTGRRSPVRLSPKQLQTISLYGYSRTREEALFFDSIMQFSDPSSLVEVEVAGGLVSTAVFERLSCLPNLRRLVIGIAPDDDGAAMAEILPQLRNMKTLEFLDINPYCDTATVVDSPVSLETLLQALPPTIRMTSILDLRFRPEESDSIPLREVPVSWPSSLSILQVWFELNEGNDILLWRDKADKSGKWHRYEEDLQASEELVRLAQTGVKSRRSESFEAD